MAEKNPFSDPTFGADKSQNDQVKANPFSDPEFGKDPSITERAAYGFKRMVGATRTALTDSPDKVGEILADQTANAPRQSVAARRMQEEIRPYQEAARSSEGAVDTVKNWGALGFKRAGQFITEPAETVKSIAEQIPNSLPGVAGGIAGAKAGAALGTAVAPGIGTAAGAVAGGLLGGLAGGYLTEKGSSIQEQVQKKAAESGVNQADAAGLAGVYQSNQADIDQAAALKGVGTAGTDAVLNVLTMGLSGAGRRMLSNEVAATYKAVKAGSMSAADGAKQLALLEARQAAQNTIGSKALRGAGVVAGEMGGEALSEAAGQKLAYGTVEPLEVIDEGLLGFGQGAAMGLASGAVNKLAGTPKAGGIDDQLKELSGAVNAKKAIADAQQEPGDPKQVQGDAQQIGASITGTDPASLMRSPIGGIGGDGNGFMDAIRKRKPSEAMGIDPAAGSLSAAAAMAVDTGAHQPLGASIGAYDGATLLQRASEGNKPLQEAMLANDAERTRQAETAIPFDNASEADRRAYEDAFDRPAPTEFLALSADERKSILFGNKEVNDGGQQFKGTQDGDILNGIGAPFKTRFAAARRARMMGEEWSIAPVADGFVARWKGPANDGSTASGPASTGIGQAPQMPAQPSPGSDQRQQNTAEPAPDTQQSGAQSAPAPVSVQGVGPGSSSGNDTTKPQIPAGNNAQTTTSAPAAPAAGLPAAGPAPVQAAGVSSQPSDDQIITGKRAAYQALKKTGAPEDVISASVIGYQEKADKAGAPMTLWRSKDGALGLVPAANKSPFALGEKIGTIYPTPQSDNVTALQPQGTPANVPQPAQPGTQASKTPSAQGAAQAGTAVAKPKNALQKRIQKDQQARADYFTPGNIVKSYSGHDRVIGYTPPVKDGGSWSVRVQAVVKQGDKWVNDPKDNRERQHSTPPDAKELASGPVFRNPVQPQGATSEPQADQAQQAEAQRPQKQPAAAGPVATANPKIKAALDKKQGLGAQLAALNAELERQVAVQNANTRAQRDAIRMEIAKQDFPDILKAVDDNLDVAEELSRAFKYAGDEPKAKTIERILKKRGITTEYQARWTERLMAEEADSASVKQAGTKPEVVVKVPEAISTAIEDQLRKQKQRVMRRRNEESAPGLNLEQKAAAQTKTKAAEATLRQMRTSIFEAEDAAIKAIETGKASEFEKHADLFPAANDAIRAMLGQNDELDAETQAYESGLTAQTRADDVKKLASAAKFTGDGVGRSPAEKELQAQSHKIEQPGDVLMADGSFVAFDTVVAMAREGIESGEIRPAPAQMHFKLDMAMRDATRVLDAATSTTDLMGFTKAPTGNGSFTLSDSNMRVTVEPTGTGFQARMGSAESGPRLTEQQAIGWAAALRDESIRIQKQETKGPRVIINKLGKDGLTDAERAAGKPSYADKPAKEPAAPAVPKQPSAAELRAQADLNNALADLGDIFSKPFKAHITPEQEQKLLPVLTRVLDAAFRLGYAKFKDAAKFALDKISAALGADVADALTLGHLQGAYIAMAGGKQGSEGIMDVAKITSKDEILAHTAMTDAERNPAPADGALETAGNSEDTAPKDTQNDPTDPISTPALNQPVAEGQPIVSNDAARGAKQPRRKPGRANDRGIREDGGLFEGLDDEGGNVGGGRGDSVIPDAADDALAGSGGRVSAPDFRPSIGGLKREGSWHATAARNLDLIDLARQIESENRPATPEEQERLSKYVGFGASEIRNAMFPVPSSYQKQVAKPGTLIFPDAVYDARWKALAERAAALPVEWQRTILQSTQYAHYTSESIIRSMWSGMQRLGFTGGKVFEAGSGIGSFSMLMPDEVRNTSNFTGIEFDGPTALIARLLSPQQNMLHDDFIKRRLPDNFFDVAVGNPPFSQTKVTSDPRYQKHGFMLHDYFFAKSLDKLRPGGVLAYVTSKGTMDKQSDKARRYLMERADLLGAIRLPSTAFEDNAGTSVVTDVIFLRKRLPGTVPGGHKWASVATVETKDGPVVVNEYFAANPDMVLGQQRISGNTDDMGRRINSNGRGGEKYTVVSYDKTPEELDAKFAAAIERLPANVYSALSSEPGTLRSETAKMDFDPSVKREGVVYVGKSGDLLRVEYGIGKPLADSVKLSAKDTAWLTDYVGVRDLVKAAQMAQVTDGAWELALKKLNKGYDAFVKKHGPINAFRVQVRKSTDEDGGEVETSIRIFTNRRLFREDYDSALMTQLEVIDEDGNVKKAPFLTGRTIGKPVTREVKSIGDALAVSLDSIGSLNLDDVAARLHISRDEAIDALGNQIYREPGGDWLLADEYLSGNVVDKLEEAIDAARLDPSLARNVEALKEVQPEKLGPSQISVKLGAPWVDAKHVTEFAKEIEAGEVTFDHKTETWQVQGGNERRQRRAGAEWGTASRSPSELLEAILNSRSIKVMRKEDKKDVVDEDATTAANEMAKRIKDKFKSWVWTDSERAADLVEAYNQRYNNLAPRVFDGSHLTLPGVSLRYKLHPHQLRAIWRQIQTGSTYLAHAVGAGKTIEMIAGGMEQKRLGLIRKPIYVVPNHMLEQFSNEFMELYPLANIMVADDQNFSKERRKAFVAAATLNAPDAIVITHDAFQRIGVKEESIAPIRDEILADLEEELESAAKDAGARVRRSQLEQQIEAVNQRFDSILSAGRKDGTVSFEDMGVDFVYADEAHTYRKLDFHTSQSIKGIDPNGSRRALDMYVKTRFLDRQRPGRAMVFASGTAVTNTMGELFTIMRFFDQKTLDEGGISTFDSWARMFGEVGSALEQNAAGKYEVVERFSRFDNVPELMSRVRRFMDVLQSDQLGAIVKRPDTKGGKPELILVPPTKAMKDYQAGELQRRLDISREWKPSKDEPNNPDPVIAIITDGRFAATDPRFIPGGKVLPGESTKIDEAAIRIGAEYKATAKNEYVDRDGKPMGTKGGTQIVFYNVGFGSASGAKRGFNARDAFTKRIIAEGVKREHIVWFDDADTDAKKEAIFKGMRNGTYRVLIGSAKKMGTGVNVQNRLTELHYMDPPWYPADVEQPRGRIIRQGNQNAIVGEKWYATKGGYDSTMWQMVGRKQRFIDQAFRGDKNLRSMDDLGEASLYEQAAALASGDPRALALAGLRQDTERLERQQAAHTNEQIAARSALSHATWQVDHASKHANMLADAYKAIGGGYYQFSSGTVNGKVFTKQTDFGQALKDAFNQGVDDSLLDPSRNQRDIGQIGDLKLTMHQGWEHKKNGENSTIRVPNGRHELTVTAGKHVMTIIPETGKLGADVDALGLVRKAVNALNGIDTDLRRQRAIISENETDIIRLRKKIGAPFEHQAEMLEKWAALKELEEELRLEGLAKPAAVAAPSGEPEVSTNLRFTGAPEGNDTDVVFSRATPFYSELARQIEAANINTAPVIGWKAMLKGLMAKGVKADEITWSGIEEWLDLQTGKVTKAQVLDYLAANGVQVEETVLETIPLSGDELEKLEAAGYTFEEGDFATPAVIYDPDGRRIGVGELPEELRTAGAVLGLDKNTQPTKYDQYTIPGGTNYREVLLTLPEKQNVRKRVLRKDGDGRRPWRIYIEGEELHQNSFTTEEAAREDLAKYPTFSEKAGGQAYQSNHWDQKNVLAHIRVNDRTDADGRRVLFVEEIQSDWGQAGKREGFASVKHTTINALNGNVKEYATEEEARAAASAPGSALQYRADRIDGPPLAPFVDKTDKWLTLSLKRIVKMAVDGGYDKVAFVNGEQSAARYDLSKEVKNIEWTQYGSGTKVLSINPKSGNAIEVLVEEDGTTASVSGRDAEFAGKPLSDVVGKEIAEKIMAQRSGDLRGDGLKVGGEGMKAFYDQIVPSATKALLKKLGGGQMEIVQVGSPEWGVFSPAGDPLETGFKTKEAAVSAAEGYFDVDIKNEGGGPQPGFTITPAMQEKASNGLPLFRRQLAKFSRGAQKQANNAVQSTVDKLTADWQNKPEIVIAFDMQDEAIPDNVRLEDAKQRSGGAFGNPEGFYYRGVVYLLSSQLATDADIARVLAHESLGHYGLRGLYGKALKPILQQIATMRRADVIAVARQRGLVKVDGNNRPIVDVKTATNAQVWAAMTDSHKSQSAEEVLAEMAQTTPQAGFVKRAVAAIRQWLREHGVNLKLTDNDIIVNYILPARGWVERGPGGGGPKGGVSFARGAKSGDAENTRYTRQWYDRLVSLLPDSYRNDPYRREPLPAEGRDVQQAREVQDKIDALNKQIRGPRDTKGHGPVTRDELGNLTVDAREATYSEIIGEIKDLADEIGYGVSVTGVQRRLIEKFKQAGFESEISLAAIADRITGARAEISDEKSVYAVQALGTIMSYKPRGFPMALFSRAAQASLDASWTDDRIKRLMSSYAYTMDDNRTKAYAGMVRPDDFLAATTTTDDISRIESESQSLDESMLRGEVQEIRLYGKLSGGEFITDGHEGRHRMMALRDAGVAEVPVTFIVGTTNGATPLSGIRVQPQNWGGGLVARSGFVSGELTPVSWAHHAELKEKFGGDADVMFSRATTARDLTKKATEAVRVFTNTPGKVNWWHKTIGTQYNLAQRSPQFKRVYDAVQDFIGDVSFYATEAADLAPQILPKLDTWRDIAKSPLSADDTKAIAAPIFEGTLVWARDEAGRPVKIKQLEDEAALMSSDRKAQRLLRNDKISEGVLKMWRGLPMEQYEALIDGKYEKEMLKGGLVWSDAELKSQFNLNDGQIALYREFRASTDKSLTNLAISDMLYFGGKDVAPIKEAVLEAKTVNEAAEMLRDYLLSLADMDPANAESLIATANKMIDKGDRASDLMARGYAPLSRFGTYTLDVVDADGERVYFGLFESRFEADRMAKQMAAEYPGSTVEQGTLSEESYKLFAGVSPETVALFGDMLGLEDNGAYQDYLKLAKSTRSAMKRLIERKGIAGFSEDAGRVLAGFVYSNARQTSQNLHTGEMVQAANDIPKGMGELKDKATQLVEYIKHPQEEAQKIRGLLFAQYIGGSIASAMVNMTQPLTMTLPWLTQFGGLSKASKQMAAAVKDATRKTTGDKALDAALKRGEEDGTVSPQEVHDLMRQAQGRGALQSGDGTKAGDAAAKAQNALSRIGFAWGKLFSAAEQFNRRVTFIAAYRTAVEQKMADPDAFARKAIAETQGIYNKGNKPDWARGAVGSTLFTFKQYSVAYVEMMHRMATQGGPEGRRAALYGLAILMLLSGAGGAPGADDLDDIISGAMQALGYNFDSKAARRRFLSEHLGDGGADFVERGVSGLPGVPIDVSGRLGLGNLIPGTGLLTRKQDHTRDVMEIAGPAGDLFARAFEASGKLLKGNIGGHAGAVATIAPKAVSNLFQAADMAETGMYRDKNGNKVIETDAGDAAVKALGFQPNAVKRVQESSIEVQRMASLNRIREKEIADKWAKGLFEKDQDKVQEAMDDMKRWNEDNPETPIRINFAQIRSRLHTMNLSKSERIAKTAPSELRMQVRQALEAQ